MTPDTIILKSTKHTRSWLFEKSIILGGNYYCKVPDAILMLTSGVCTNFRIWQWIEDLDAAGDGKMHNNPWIPCKWVEIDLDCDTVVMRGSHHARPTFEFWAIKPSSVTDPCDHVWYEHPELQHWRVCFDPLPDFAKAARCSMCGAERTVSQMVQGEKLHRYPQDLLDSLEPPTTKPTGETNVMPKPPLRAQKRRFWQRK